MEERYRALAAILDELSERIPVLRRELESKIMSAAQAAAFVARAGDVDDETAQMRARFQAMLETLLDEVTGAVSHANDEVERVLDYWLDDD